MDAIDVFFFQDLLGSSVSMAEGWGEEGDAVTEGWEEDGQPIGQHG